MNPDADKLWHAPRWALAVLLAVLGMLGPFSIDTYIPAFSGIAQLDRRDAGRDAADALGLPVRLRLHEPVPRRAVGQLRPPAGGAVGPGGVHARLAGLRAVADHRPAGAVPRAAGPVDRRRHRRLARGHPRHVPAGRGAEGDEPGHDLLRRRAGHRADRRRLPVRAPGLAQHLLVPGRRSAWCCSSPTSKLLPETLHLDQRQPFEVRPPDARLLGPVLRPALPAAGAGQRRALQRHVPLRAGGARLPRRPPGARRRRSSSGSSC